MKKYLTIAVTMIIYSLSATARETQDLNELISNETVIGPTPLSYHASEGHIDISSLSKEEQDNRLRLFQQYSKVAYERYMKFQKAGLLGGGSLIVGLLSQFLCTGGILSEQVCNTDVVFYGSLLVPLTGGLTLAASLITMPPLSPVPGSILLTSRLAWQEGVVKFTRTRGSELQQELKKRGYMERISDRIAWQGRTDRGLNLLGIYED